MSNTVSVGIYQTSSNASCRNIAVETNCSLVIVEDLEQLKKYTQQWEEITHLKYIVLLDKKAEIPPNPLPKGKKILRWN